MAVQLSERDLSRRSFLIGMVRLPLVAAAVSLVGLDSSDAYALNMTTDNYLVGFGPSTKGRLAKLARKVGAKQKWDDGYPDFYAKGKKMTIGVNGHADYPDYYVYIRNAGNPNVKVMGVKVGMAKEKARARLSKKGWRTYMGARPTGGEMPPM